jgi:YtkA-like
MADKNADKNQARSIFIAVVASAVGLAACSSSSGETTGGSSAGATSTPSTNAASCPTWTGSLDAYGGADVTHEGTANAFNFVLTNIAPAPPALGTTTWTLKILDASGQPVKDATFTDIKTWMPQHMHPSTALPVPASNGDGTYDVTNLYLYMAGVWQVTFTAKSGDTTDSAMFTFCLGS